MFNGLKSKFYKLLRWSQQYTQTDMVYIAKGGFWLSLGQIISIFASFLLAVAFANLLNPTVYGTYKYILSWIGILGIFSLNGINTAVTQSVARGLENSFYTGFKTKLKWGILGSLGALGLAGYYWWQGNPTLPIPLLISAIFLPLVNASGIYGEFLLGKKLFNFRMKYSTASYLLSVLFLILTVFLTKNLFWLIAVYLISNTLLGYIFYLITQIKFKPNRNDDPQTISYGKHLSLMGVISTVASYIDQILLFTFIGSTQVAIYSFASAVPEKIKEILQNINTLALPKLAAKSREEIKKGLKRKLYQLTILTIAVMAVYFLFAPYIYQIFFPKYLAAVPYSKVLTLIFITYPASFITMVFQAKMMKRELYFLNSVNPIVQIILLLTLTPLFGIWGVVGAIISTKIFSLIFTLFLARKI